MDIDRKINQLKQAFLVNNIILIINTEEWYSMEFKKTCKKFVVRFDTEEKMVRRVKLRERICLEKKELKKHKKKSKEHEKIKNNLEWLNEELKGYYASKDEFYSKKNVLLFLVDEWNNLKKELVDNG